MGDKIHEIDGVKYREVERKAKVGDRVWLVHAEAIEYITEDDFTTFYRDGEWDFGEYRVLEPITSPTDRDDIIANLVRRVTELERYVYETDAEPTPIATAEEIDRAVEAKREREAVNDIAEHLIEYLSNNRGNINNVSYHEVDGDIFVGATIKGGR